MFIDHRFFPHIIDTILSYSSIDVLHTFYDLSAKYERRVLTYFPTHIVIELDEDGGCLLQSRDLGIADQWTVLHYGLDDISIGTDSPDREELFWQKVLEQAGIVDIMGLRFVGDLDSGIYPALSSARTVRYHSAGEVNPITAEALVLFADLISVSHAPAMTLRGKEEDTPCPTSITLSLDCHIDPLAVQTGYPLFDPLTCSIRQSYEQRFREPAIVTIVLQDKRKGRRSKPAQDPSTDVLRGYLCNLGAKGKTVWGI